MYRRCFALLGNEADAEDALQEVFVKAMRAADQFRGDAAPSTWLYRISTNHCLNVLRGRQRQRRRADSQAQMAAALGPVGSAAASRMEAATLIRELLPQFDKRSQELAVYYFVDGMALAEVAATAGLSVPTVRKYLQKFIDRAKRLTAAGGDR